jgi:hypothetical protein
MKNLGILSRAVHFFVIVYRNEVGPRRACSVGAVILHYHRIDLNAAPTELAQWSG